MNGDLLYAVLMSFGWLFLLGWLTLLLVACLLAFRADDGWERSTHAGALAGGGRTTAGVTGRFKIHLRG